MNTIMNFTEKGFGLLGILIIVGIIVGIGSFIFTSVFPDKNPFVPTSEEKSAIDMAEQVKDVMEEKNNDTTNVSSSQAPDSSNPEWKTYRNEEYGFEVKYPIEWTVISEFIAEPAIAPTLVNKKFTDPKYQFRFLIVFVYTKKQTPTFDTSPGKIVYFPGGNGIRYGQNNLNFLTEKGDYVIQLLSSHEKYRDEFFSEILSTFKFIE
ncbi:MAG: hypothetical protein G01um101470_23 [Parcubacteria group bacterium Gr01-1014_70]|nr:MAG: hypothetical protein G01um101470_23 [Parcubacteria group bacterium Gr01-1014_70]